MFGKIVVPLDGSHLAEKALLYAKVLAKKFNARLILVRVVSPPRIAKDFSQKKLFNQVAREEKTAAQLYQKAIQNNLTKHHFAVSTVVLENHSVADAIIELACQESVDLIVMSTHGRSGISRWVHGSVASKLLQQSPCPIFLVRAADNKIITS